MHYTRILVVKKTKTHCCSIFVVGLKVCFVFQNYITMHNNRAHNAKRKIRKKSKHVYIIKKIAQITVLFSSQRVLVNVYLTARFQSASVMYN